MENNKPELLAPAGNLVMLRTALDSGADAVYFGIKSFNMRTRARNFELNQLRKIVRTCHDSGARAYLALNIIIYDDELDTLDGVIREARQAGVDAVICWDMSVIQACKRHYQVFHVSTQASVSNFDAARFYYELGAARIVLARECTLDQIRGIKNKIREHNLGLELEAFVHGAMCVSVSGRCFMSQFVYNKSANRGECIQNCRREYIVKDSETDAELTVGSNYVLSPRDLSTIMFIDELMDVGIDSFKIEGRARSEEYVKTVVSAYRKAVDACSENKFDKKLKDSLNSELETVYNRGFSSGFYMGRPLSAWTDDYGSMATRKKIYLGKVENYFAKASAFEMRVVSNSFTLDDEIMVQGPTTGVVQDKPISIQSYGEDREQAGKNDHIGVKFSAKVRRNDKVFKIVDA